MAYYNRREQLIKTLESIRNTQYKNVEIIVVDDASDEGISDLEGIRVIEVRSKTWVNPCIPYNMAIKESRGDIIILQNPEVLHVGDCIQYVIDNLTENDWLTFNCYGLPNFEQNDFIYQLSDKEKYEFISALPSVVGGNGVARDKVGGWLNHYHSHFVAYHYLGAIYKSTLMGKMGGGFNEVFQNGVVADDDEFIKRLLYNNINFKINRFDKGQPFTIHQYHKKPPQLNKRPPVVTTNKRGRNRVHLPANQTMTNNVDLFKHCCIQMGLYPQNDIELAPKNEIPMSRQILL